MSDPYNAVISALMSWGRSGLIPNTRVIKSYFPPTTDPVSGVPVLIPATVYVTGPRKAYTDTSRPPDPHMATPNYIDTLPNAPVAGSSVLFNLTDVQDTGGSAGISSFSSAVDVMAGLSQDTFSGDERVSVGTMAVLPVNNATAAKTLTNGLLYSSAATAANDQTEYYKNGAHLDNKNTYADRAARFAGLSSLPRITDSHEDAKVLYTDSADPSTEEPVKNVAVAHIPDRYDVFPTKVPCAMPGVLNCYIGTVDEITPYKPAPDFDHLMVFRTKIPPSNSTPAWQNLRQQATAPTINVQIGDKWWDTAHSKMYNWTGTTWQWIKNAELEPDFYVIEDPRWRPHA